MACLVAGIFVAGWRTGAAAAASSSEGVATHFDKRQQKSRILGIRRLRPLTQPGGNRGGWNGPEPSGIRPALSHSSQSRISILRCEDSGFDYRIGHVTFCVPVSNAWGYEC